jgi:hypothetical protein
MRELFTCGQTAKILGVSIPTLRRMRKEHRGPAFITYPSPRRRGLVKYHRAAVLEFLRAHTSSDPICQVEQ